MTTKTETNVTETAAEVKATKATKPAATKATKPAAQGKKQGKATTATKPAAKAKKEAAPKAEKPASKKSLCVPIVSGAIKAGTARKDTVAKLMTELGISQACANTYYQNVKSGAWA